MELIQKLIYIRKLQTKNNKKTQKMSTFKNTKQESFKLFEVFFFHAALNP